MVKIEDVLKYTNDEYLQNIFKEKVAEEGAKEDFENIKKILGNTKIEDVDIILLIEKLPDSLKEQKEELLKMFQDYTEQEDEIQNYYEDKYFKLGVMEALTIIINYFKNKKSKTKQEERVISEIGQVVIPIEYRKSLKWEYKDKLDVILDEEAKEVRLKKKTN